MNTYNVLNLHSPDVTSQHLIYFSPLNLEFFLPTAVRSFNLNLMQMKLCVGYHLKIDA